MTNKNSRTNSSDICYSIHSGKEIIHLGGNIDDPQNGKALVPSNVYYQILKEDAEKLFPEILNPNLVKVVLYYMPSNINNY